MNESEFRIHVQQALNTLNAQVEAAIAHELNCVSDLGHSERLHFEAQPNDFSICLIQTETDVVPLNAVDEAISFDAMEEAEESGIDWYTCISDELVQWFADRWTAVDGPQKFSPAYLFFHWGLESPRLELEQREWFTVQQVWPEVDLRQ